MIYAPALRLPFTFDDLNQIPYAKTTPLVDLWRGTGGFTYYRPLGFTLWHLGARLAGSQHALLQHAINLIMHAGNGLLLVLLGEAIAAFPARPRLTGRGWMAATLFLLYPFSYQAVPWVGAQFHLLVTALILGATLSYLFWRRTGRARWAATSLMLAMTAPFAHENGLLLPLLLALVAWAATGSLWQRHEFVWLLPAVAWVGVRLWLVDGPADGFALNNVETIGQNTAYFLQGMAYPLTALGGWIVERLGWNDLRLAVGLAALGLAGAALVGRSLGASRREFWPWFWAPIAFLPVVPLLAFGYVLAGARLLLLASAGIAWLWADMLWRLFQQPGARRLTAAVLLTWILVQNSLFGWRHVRLHTLPGDAVNQAVSMAQSSAEPVVFVNMPSWTADRRRTFPLGHEGVTILPGYFAVELLVTAQAPDLPEVTFIRFDDLKPIMPYHYEVAGSGIDWSDPADTGARMILADYTPEAITMRLVGDLAVAARSGPPLAAFGGAGSVSLAAAEVVQADDGWHVSLTWQDLRPPVAATVFVHALDTGGALVAQADGQPLAGMYPMTLWPAGTAVLDVRYLPAEVPVHTLTVGLYDPVTGARWPATRPDGNRWPDDAVAIPVR